MSPCFSSIDELQAVTPRVVHVAAADGRDRVVVRDFHACGSKPLSEQVVRGRSECRVRLACGSEVVLDPDVQLLAAAAKPHPATRAERLRLLEFRQAEQLAVEPTRLGLASCGSGDLHVVEAVDHTAERSRPWHATY